MKTKPPHPLQWLLEPLEESPTYFRKKMFGCEAVYLRGRLVLVLAAGDEPWNGILIPTDRDLQPGLQKTWKPLTPHSVLGKWLYLSQNDNSFEDIAMSIVDAIYKEDPRIGVESKPRKKRKSRIT